MKDTKNNYLKVDTKIKEQVITNEEKIILAYYQNAQYQLNDMDQNNISQSSQNSPYLFSTNNQSISSNNIQQLNDEYSNETKDVSSFNNFQDILQNSLSQLNQEEEETQKENNLLYQDSLNDAQNDQIILPRKTKYSPKLYQKRKIEPEFHLSLQKKFFLFVDQVIDLEYFKNLDNIEEYLRHNQSTRIYNGLRFIDQVIHRLDNKCIEINMQAYETKVESMDYVVECLKSLQNKDAMRHATNLNTFKNCCLKYQDLIKKQVADPLFQQHQQRRKEAANEVFRKVTSQLDQTKFIQYQRLAVDYKKNMVESRVTGFTPALYELLSIDSYSFKDSILKYGYFDPITQKVRIEQCIERATRYLSAPPIMSTQATTNQYAQIEIITCDNFKFLVDLKINRIVLEDEYDKQNDLTFEFRDVLNIYEFSFKDQQILDQFLNIRRNQRIEEQKLETINETFDFDNFDYRETDFFNKYYGDQLQNLLRLGNKWFKKCGYVDIPKKKQKKQNEYQ